MKQYFDVFVQPELDRMRVLLGPSNGNPASLSDDEELLIEYQNRLQTSESFRLLVNKYDDFLIGKQILREKLDKIPF